MILDSNNIPRIKKRDESERCRDELIRYQQEHLRNTIYVKEDDNISMIDSVSQFGQAMSYIELEKKLRLLKNGANFVFLEYGLRPFRAVCYRMPNGKLITISAYGRTIIPEWSTMILRPKIIGDLSLRHISPRDLPEVEWRGPQEGFVPKNENELKPGMIKVYEMWGENENDPMARGWRTVLLRILDMGLADVTEIESIFGTPNRKSWSQGAGKRNWGLPYC